MYLNQCIEHMKVNRWILLQITNHTHLVRKRALTHLAKLAKWMSCVVSNYLYSALSVCFYHDTYTFRVNLHSVVAWMPRNSLQISPQNTHSLIIFPVWLNDWTFVYEISGYWFDSRCSHFNLRYRACFEQWVSWYSSNSGN